MYFFLELKFLAMFLDGWRKESNWQNQESMTAIYYKNTYKYSRNLLKITTLAYTLLTISALVAILFKITTMTDILLEITTLNAILHKILPWLATAILLKQIPWLPFYPK